MLVGERQLPSLKQPPQAWSAHTSTLAIRWVSGRRHAWSRLDRTLSLRDQVHDATVVELGPQDGVLGQQHLIDRSKAINVDTQSGNVLWPGFPFGGEEFSPTGIQAWGGFGPSALGQGFIQYMVTQNPSVNWLDVDPAQYISRLAFLASQIDAVNPDLSRFKARGGKLILWTGLTTG